MFRTKTWAAFALGIIVLAACSESNSPTAPRSLSRPEYTLATGQLIDGVGNVVCGETKYNGQGEVSIQGLGLSSSEYSINPPVATSPYDLGDGGSITISGDPNGEDPSINWSSTGVTVAAVIVKATNGAWVYYYNGTNGGPTTSHDEGLVTPDAGGTPAQLSHITVCFGPGDDNPCEEGSDLTDGHCCPTGVFWNEEFQQCGDPDTQAQVIFLSGDSIQYGDHPIASKLSFTTHVGVLLASDPRIVNFTSTSGCVVSATGDNTTGYDLTVTFTSVGSCTVTASQTPNPLSAPPTLWTGNPENAIFQITPAPLTITASDQRMTYGGTVPGCSVADPDGYTGLVYSEPTSVVTTGACTSTAPSAPSVNTYPDVYTPSGYSATNYTISYENGDLTVTPARLNIVAHDTTIWSYQAIPACKMDFNTFVNGDDEFDLVGLSCPTPLSAGNDVYQPSGATNPNYDIHFYFGDLTILTCAYSQGYWKTHPTLWDTEISGLPNILGRNNQAGWLLTWNQAVNGNGFIQLAYQYQAAYLNKNLYGSSWNPATQAATVLAFNSAEALLALGSLTAPAKPAKNANQATIDAYNLWVSRSNQAFAMAATLQAWNAGAPSHCTSDPGTT